MEELSIGEVAGAINFGLLFLQITLPMLQVLVLMTMLNNRHTAATWSIVSQLVLSTSLPSVLSCDVAEERKTGIPLRIAIMKYTILFGAILVAISSIITPIGLGEVIVPGPLVNATFSYAPDSSIFGNGTPSRQDYMLTRTCGRAPCPGVNVSDIIKTPSGLKIRPEIPTNLTECFRSGTSAPGDLRCNPFEIQFRDYYTSTLVSNETNFSNTTGYFSMVESILVDGIVEAREGIIIDAVRGGIGLRNHTVPTEPQMKYGAEWTEDILWIEPVTSCANTNWTLDTRKQLLPFANGPNSAATTLTIINNGYIGGNRPYDGPTVLPGTQSDPRLEERSSIAAYRFGGHLSRLIGANESISSYTISPGARDRDNHDNDLQYALVQFGGPSVGLFLGQISESWDSMAKPFLPSQAISTTLRLGPSETASAVFDQHGLLQGINLEEADFNLSAFNVTKWNDHYSKVQSAYFGQVLAPLYDNYGYDTFENSRTPLYTPPVDSFEAPIKDCEGLQWDPRPSIDNIFVQCGYAMTPPRPSDGSYSTTNVEQNLTQSIYVCASAVRATIKTVTFYFDGSDNNLSLEKLRISKVEPKSYTDGSKKPVWGVENPGPSWTTADIQLLWSIVDGTRYSDSGHLSTVQNDSLYLPAFIQQPASGVGFGDSMGASRGPGLALLEVYQSKTAAYGYGRYDGTSNRRMLLKWHHLSDTPENATLIPNLIWTDHAANMLVGAKSLTDACPSQTYQVRMYRRKITYNYLYGIPALFCWSFWVICLAAMTIYSMVSSHQGVGIRRWRDLVNRLSVGRALVAIQSPDPNHLNNSTSDWMRNAGQLEIHLFDIGATNSEDIEGGGGDDVALHNLSSSRRPERPEGQDDEPDSPLPDVSRERGANPELERDERDFHRR